MKKPRSCVGEISERYSGSVDCNMPTPIPERSLATSQCCQLCANVSAKMLCLISVDGFSAVPGLGIGASGSSGWPSPKSKRTYSCEHNPDNHHSWLSTIAFGGILKELETKISGASAALEQPRRTIWPMVWPAD